jgi:hypothetical protein
MPRYACWSTVAGIKLPSDAHFVGDVTAGEAQRKHLAPFAANDTMSPADVFEFSQRVKHDICCRPWIIGAVAPERAPRVRRKRDWRYSLLLPRVVGLNQQYIRARDAALVISQQCDPNRPVPRKPRKTRAF